MSLTATWKPDPFPKGALIGAAALIGFALIAAFVGRVTGLGAHSSPPAATLESRDMRFADRQDGSVLVTTLDGREVAVVAPSTEHFLRTTLRGLVRIRRADRIGNEPPFRLSRLADGHVTLEDPATRRRIDLAAFGRTNAAAFASILDAALRIP